MRSFGWGLGEGEGGGYILQGEINSGNCYSEQTHYLLGQ